MHTGQKWVIRSRKSTFSGEGRFEKTLQIPHEKELRHLNSILRGVEVEKGS